MKTPLLIGTDLTNLSQQNIDLWKNPYLLAFNQDDVYGAPATPYKWGTNPDWTYNEHDLLSIRLASQTLERWC